MCSMNFQALSVHLYCLVILPFDSNIYIFLHTLLFLLQTQVIATTATGVAAYGLPPEVSKAEAENAAQHFVALVDCNCGVNAC